MAHDHGPRRVGRLALYAGGFLGPFGGGLINVLIPELRHAFAASTAQVTAGITAYLVPFAALQLVSGTVGARLGIARVVRGAYVAYAITSAAVAVVTTVDGFLVARALQGAANAFITPLLLAALADATPEASLGRAMGTFAAVQTAGIVSAPLCGGLAAAVDYRLAFVGPAAAACLLACAPPPSPSRAAAHAARLRTALTRRTAWVAAAAFLAYLAVTGLAFLVAIRAADAFGLGPTSRGLLLAGFGLTGVLAGRPAGGLVDRHGPRRVATAGAVACAALVPLLGIAGTPALLAAVWLATGLGSALVWAGVNVMAVQAAPRNRAGAVSVIGALKFAGNAVAPALWLPVYAGAPEAAFAGAGTTALVLALVARHPGVTRDPAPHGPPAPITPAG